MTVRPMSEQSARKILSIFKAFNIRAGHVLMTRYVDTKFLASGGSADELKAGMLYAAQQGWLEVASHGIGLHLTQTGFEEM